MFRINVTEFLKETRRRRVFRTAGLYIVGAWVVVQIALAVFPALSISEAAVRFVWLAAILGFPVAIIFGWRYDLHGGRIVKTGPVGNDIPLSLQRADVVILTALGFVALAILTSSLQQISDMEPEQAEFALPSNIEHASVAVLPFANMSADPDNEYFSDGLTETLLHMLAQLQDIKVAARTSSFAFKGQNQDIREIALALGVAHVLEGSVQKAGERVRVTAQLIRADDGFHVWSQNYDRTLNDIFAIQDEISSDVAAALGSSLLTTAGTAIHNIDTEDFSAYDIYLQALEQLNIGSSDSLLESQRLFMIAIDKDPDFVDAKLGLARNYIELWSRDVDDLDRFDLDAQELLGEIREQRPDHLSAQIMELLVQYFIGTTEKQTWEVDPELQAIVDEIYALALTGNIGPFLTHRVVNLISGYPRFQDEEALELLRGAIEDDPLNFELLWAQANLFRATDRPEQAKQPLLTAARVAPENPQIPISLAYLAKSQFNFAEALEWFRHAMTLDSNDPTIPMDIAFTFYDLEFVEEGDYWADKVRAMEAEPCLISILDVESADLNGDTDRLTELLTRDLALAISERGFCYFPINYFVRTMSEQGRSQQGLDILSELIPDISDYSEFIVDNRRSQYIQVMSVLLYYDILEFGEFQELHTIVIDAFTEAAPTWREAAAPYYEILYDGTSGDRDYAKKLFLETHGDPLDMGDGRWKQFLRAAPLEDFRQDPEVASVIEKYYELRAKNVAGVRKLLDTPEWQRTNSDR